MIIAISHISCLRRARIWLLLWILCSLASRGDVLRVLTANVSNVTVNLTNTTAAITNVLGNLFTWPAGIQLTGPYASISVNYSNLVIAPNGSTPAEGDLLTHQYHHHTRIFWTAGVTFLAFASANTNEGDGGTQTAICISTNRGTNWTAPILIVPSQSKWDNAAIVDGERITYPRDWETLNGTNYLIVASDRWTNGGRTHGDALMACPVFTNGTVGMTVLIATNGVYGSIDGKAVPDYDAIIGPPLLALSKLYGCWGGSQPGGGSASSWVGWLWNPSPDVTFVEPNIFSADGSTTNFFRIWRVAGPASLLSNVWQQYTIDAGANWSAPVQSGIPNSPSETTGLRLTDGRFVVVGNPRYMDANFARDPLFLAVTDVRSLTFTNVYDIVQGIGATPVYPGWAKGGGASYCHAVQVGNYLYVSYSCQKERICFSRVLIPGLADNNNDPWPGE